MFQTDLFKGRNILITGGGTGLGRSMALRFAELGANIFLVARREEPLKETAEAIRAKGARAAYLPADIRDFNAVEKAVEAAEKEFGGVDTLVNNAAGNFIARTEKLSPNAFNAVVGIVLQGTFYLHAGAREEMDRGEAARSRVEYRHHLRRGELRLGICGAVGVRQGRRAGADAVAGGGMGAAPYSAERHRARTISHRRRMVAFDAVEGTRRAREEASPHGPIRTPRRARESCGVSAEQSSGLREWRMRGD